MVLVKVMWMSGGNNLFGVVIGFLSGVRIARCINNDKASASKSLWFDIPWGIVSGIVAVNNSLVELCFDMVHKHGANINIKLTV